jgi:TetR/AcrR family transcriptional repressor of nem operon
MQLAEYKIPATFGYQTVGFMNVSKEHILISSLTLFLKKGFKEVTMKEIVDTTGMSKGAFYHYFSSKEQVFSEVIDYFFFKTMTTDFAPFSRDSLKAFYTDILGDYVKNRKASASLVPASRDNELSNNYFYLIFDAMRLLPDFKEKLARQQKQELVMWTEVAAKALNNGEIRTRLTAEQVSKMFINLGDGTHLSLILGKMRDHVENELQVLWDGLYESLKGE